MRGSEPKAACDERSGRLLPVIDRNRCEAKNDCVVVCPYNVFELRLLTPEERAPFSWIVRFKLWVRGGKQAFAVRGPDCRACGLCVTACPEKAIRLVKA